MGSVRQLTDDTEAVVAEYTYDAFGNLVASSGASENVYKFTGEQFDSSSGLLYLRARYYDSSIGRFISRDPMLQPMCVDSRFIWGMSYLIRLPQSLNPYVYVKNNPLNHVDPTGLAECDWNAVWDCFLGSHDWTDTIYPVLCIGCLLSGGGPFCIVPCGAVIASELLKLPDCMSNYCHKEPNPCE